MNGAAPFVSFLVSCGRSSQPQDRNQTVKHLASTRRGLLTKEEALSDLVVTALWQSFPECDNEPEIAAAARIYFRDKRGEPISERTIRYWLRGQTLPSAVHIATLVQMQPKLFLGAWLGGRE